MLREATHVTGGGHIEIIGEVVLTGSSLATSKDVHMLAIQVVLLYRSIS